MVLRIAAVLIMSMLLTSSTQAGDWPHYGGPSNNASSDETGLLRSWGADGPEVLWTTKTGPGFGGPAVVDGKVYLLDRDGDVGDVMRCLDLASGKDLWSVPLASPGNMKYHGSRSIPTVADGRVSGVSQFGDLYCVDIKTRKMLWRTNTWTDYGGEKRPIWGFSQSPVAYDGLLIVAAQTPKVGVIAFDGKTGKVAWKSPPLKGLPGYVTPALVTIEGVDQVVAISAETRPASGGSRSGKMRSRRSSAGKAPTKRVIGAVTGIDAKSGAVLWLYEGWQCWTPAPTPQHIGDGRLFITGGYEAGSAMIQVGMADGKWAAKELFKTDDFGTHVHPPVLHEGHLYAHCTSNERRDGMTCMDLAGNIKWKTERAPVFDKGGFILADGLIMAVDGKEGDLVLVEPSPKGYKEVSRARLLNSGQIWAPLALSDGKLLIRDHLQMKCVVVK